MMVVTVESSSIPTSKPTPYPVRSNTVYSRGTVHHYLSLPVPGRTGALTDPGSALTFQWEVLCEALQTVTAQFSWPLPERERVCQSRSTAAI